ncbi:hypothetical protein ACJJTC_004140 [Scirpophaga incertulas]
MSTPDTSGNSSMSITRYLRPERFDTEPGTNGAELRSQNLKINAVTTDEDYLNPSTMATIIAASPSSLSKATKSITLNNISADALIDTKLNDESPPLVNPNEDNVLPGPSSPREVLSNEGKALSPSDSSPILPVSSETAPRCSGRERRAPAYLKDYMYT